MRNNMWAAVSAVCVASLAFLTGCTTEQAKKAMDKPLPSDQYSGFGAGEADGSKRKAEKPKEVKDDMDPDKAVSTLVDQMKNPKAGYTISAEEQLTYWGQKPGVAPIVVQKVRTLLKNKDVECRAPALRLTVMFGGKESVGDLIECLGDSEYGIREMAYRAVQNYSIPRDFDFDPAGGEVARAQSVEQFRRWWQYEARKGSVQPATVYEDHPWVAAETQESRQPVQTVTRNADIVRENNP